VLASRKLVPGDKFSYQTLPILAKTSIDIFGGGENGVELAMHEWRAEARFYRFCRECKIHVVGQINVASTPRRDAPEVGINVDKVPHWVHMRFYDVALTAGADEV
jgi:hypothetical protein